ncbi:hypothetical protein ES708_05018 [subsurface metagenome]
MQTADFKKGDRVKYIPPYACGDPNHEDCDIGVVSSINDFYVFVKYDNATTNMLTDEPFTFVPTRAENLIKIP